MSQIILELEDREDIDMLLNLFRRLNINVVSLKESPLSTDNQTEELEAKKLLMRQAAKDPLFLADIAAVNSDFEHIDGEF
jgi:hypothetical protein